MRRTSIFSKDYEKIIKRRKRIKIILSIILVFILILSAIVYLNFDSLKKYALRKHNNQNSNVEETPKNDNTITDKPSTDKPKVPETAEIIVLKLDNGIEIKYSINKKDKSIKDVEKSEEINFEISEDKKYFVAFFKKTAEIFTVSNDEVVKNLTYETFITTDGTRIHRKDQLSRDPSFIWMESPKLYKDKLYYATKLPNLNNTNRYFLWMCDVNTGIHKGIYSKELRADAIVMGDALEKGLEIDFDGTKKYFNQEGKEVK